MGRRKATPEEIQTALRALHASAVRRGGKPKWADVSRKTGVNEATLRRWWKERDKVPDLEVHTAEVHELKADTPSAPPDSAEALLALGDLGYAMHTFVQANTAVQDALRQGVQTLPRLLAYRDQRYEAVKLAREAERSRTGMTEEELRDRVMSLFSDMPVQHLELALDELKRRKAV